VDEKVILKNKYFSYIPPLSSLYKPINNPFTYIKKKEEIEVILLLIYYIILIIKI